MQCALFAVSVVLLSSHLLFGVERPTLAIGSPAPEFSLPGIDGRTHTLTDYANAKVLAILFTCNHCPTAQAYEERVNRLVADYQDRGVRLVAISPNSPEAVQLGEQGYAIVGDSLEDMKTHARVYGFNYPYLYDGKTQGVSTLFGVVATPHLFLFDEARQLRYEGRIDDDESGENIKQHDARNAIDALLAGKDVPVKTTRVFGCSTKWAEKRSRRTEVDAAWAKREVLLETANAAQIARLAKNDTAKLRLINVWATWCGPCISEFPELVKINRIYKGRGLELVTVSVDATKHEPEVLKFLRSQHAAMSDPIKETLAEEGRRTNNYLYSGTDKDALAEALDPEWRGAYPHTVLIAPGGRVLFRQSGEIDPLVVRQAIVGYLGRTYAGK